MPRYAKSNITVKDLEERINKSGGLSEVLYTPKVQSDIAKIEFDLENFTHIGEEFDMPGFQPGFDTLSSGAAVLWIGAGGDWEFPVAFCLYIGDGGGFRAYIPKEGNCYNFKTKKAFGNDDTCEDIEEELERSGVEEYAFDMDKLHEDAANRIVFKQGD